MARTQPPGWVISSMSTHPQVMLHTPLPPSRALLWLCATLLAVAPVLAQADDTASGNRPAITLRTNVPYYFVGGYHLEGTVHFPGHWSVGLTVQGISELPEFGRDQFFEVSDGDITIEWPYAVGAEVMYRFRENTFDGGFYAAGSLGYEGWRALRNGGSDAEQNFANAFFAVDFGYTWYPFPKRRFLVAAEYSTVLLLNNTDRQALGDEAFELRRIAWPGLLPSAILLGWRF